MKKVMMVFLAFLLVGGFVFSNSPSMTDSDSLLIEGTVAEEISIVVNELPAAVSLVLGEAVNTKLIATTTEYSNSWKGYDLDISSANGFQLRSAENSVYNPNTASTFLEYSILWGTEETAHDQDSI